MYELAQAGERTHYVNCPSRVGIYRLNERDVCLIDSGNDKEAARRILKSLNERDWSVHTIVNTHSHADHIGGNAFLQERTGCGIFAPDVDAALAKYPIIKPSFLYGGRPFKKLRGKFLFAAPSNVKQLTSTDLPGGIRSERLDGHSFSQIALCTPDDVWFIGDALASETVLKKYHVPFLYDVERYLASLDKLETLEGKFFIPSHADPLEDVHALAEINRRKIFDIEGQIESICRMPQPFDEILKGIFDTYCLEMNVEQYVLVGSTIRSFLSYLLDAGRLDIRTEENRLLWHTV